MTFEFTRAETLRLMLALLQYARNKDNNEKNRTMALDLHDKIAEGLQNELYESSN